MKRLISAGLLAMTFCVASAQISEFVNPPKEAWPEAPGLSEDSATNPLWRATVGIPFSRYVARQEVMKAGESSDDLSALRLTEGLQCAHRIRGVKDVYHLINATDESKRVVVTKDRRHRHANVYNPKDGSVRGMIPSPDSRGVYRELEMNPREDLYVVFEKYKAPRMKVYDGEYVFAEVKDITGVASSGGSVVYTAKIDIPEKRLRKERNIGNRFLLDLGDVGKSAVLVNVNGGERADTLWSAPFAADITDRLVGGENELKITVVDSKNDIRPDAVTMLPGPLLLKLLKHKQILEK